MGSRWAGYGWTRHHENLHVRVHAVRVFADAAYVQPKLHNSEVFTVMKHIG